MPEIWILYATHAESCVIPTELSQKALIQTHILGVGAYQYGNSLQQLLKIQQPDLLIAGGIAGGSSTLQLESCVEVVSDCLLDVGTETPQKFLAIHEMGFDSSNFYGQNSPISNLNPQKTVIQVNGFTVNTCTGTQNTAESRYSHNKFPFIESMEGFALHQLANQYQIPFYHFRGISNRIGKRDLTNWRIPQAIHACNTHILNTIPLWLSKFK